MTYFLPLDYTIDIMQSFGMNICTFYNKYYTDNSLDIIKITWIYFSNTGGLISNQLRLYCRIYSRTGSFLFCVEI